jgi:hypothetical protein|tara:strand:- start:218 stop:436 length:219 start_codon:yes stop_codon:yes gene_type:complete
VFGNLFAAIRARSEALDDALRTRAHELTRSIRVRFRTLARETFPTASAARDANAGEFFSCDFLLIHRGRSSR